MPYNPNPAFNPALAIAMMPTDNFAQKRADAQASMQFELYNSELARQGVEAKQKALADIQETLSKVDKADILEQDKLRMNTAITMPLRQQAEGVLRDQYGGDIERFTREKGQQLSNQFAKAIVASPLYAKATSNKVNYTLAQEAKKKGQMIVGDFDDNWGKYARGESDTLEFGGAYDPPKNVFEYFDQNNHPVYKYGQFNGRDRRTKQERYLPVAVTQDDVYQRLTGTGLSPQQALDYMRKINYQGGRAWKMDSQSPWDAQQQANNERHQRVGEAQGWAQIKIAKDREAREVKKDADELAAKAGAADSSPYSTILREVYAGSGAKPMRMPGAKEDFKAANGLPVTYRDGIPGQTGVVLAQAAGIGRKVQASDVVVNRKSIHVDEHFESNLKSVHDIHGRSIRNKDFAPIQFKEVTPDKLAYYPSSKDSYNGVTPHIPAIAIIDGKEREVMVPVPYNQLTMGVLVNQAAIFNSKEDRAQGYMPPQTTFDPAKYADLDLKPLPR